jgi:hypothetical protein
MDRPAGSYIEDEAGKLRPNENDEAMAARHGLGKAKPGKPAAAKAAADAETEVSDHAKK